MYILVVYFSLLYMPIYPSSPGSKQFRHPIEIDVRAYNINFLLMLRNNLLRNERDFTSVQLLVLLSSGYSSLNVIIVIFRKESRGNWSILREWPLIGLHN